MARNNLLENMKIGFIGGGNMAEALIRGLLAGGVSPVRLKASDPLLAKREYLKDRYGIHVSDNNATVACDCDILILAVKPQVAGSVIPQLDVVVSAKTLLISIVAGITCEAIEGLFKKQVRLVRVMPNTPALVLRAATALSPGHNVGDADLTLAEAIFSQVGATCRVDEKLLDAVTGLSGSGPAYVLAFIEALADGGVKNGISRETAQALAAQTVLGTAQLLLETGEHPAALRDKVSSPGGTAIVGLHALEAGSFRSTVINAVTAATLRATELGKK